MTNIKKISIAVVIAVVALAIYFFFVKEKPTPIVIETEPITKGDVVTEVTATGSVQPVDEVEVGTQVSGLVRKIYVDYNSQVKKGDLIAELDKINLEENVVNATANYNSAQNEYHYYLQNYNRQQKMFEAGVISTSDFEQATYQLNNAKQIVTQRLTALNQAKTNLGYANIYAPIDGIVLSREVEEGQTVAASISSPTLFKIAKNITKMQVEANVDEADIGQVKLGQRVSFSVDAYPQEEFTGKVSQVRLSPTTTSNVVTYTVIIDAENPEEKLKPGLTATIAIYTNELRNVLIIPAKAIHFSPDTELLSSYYEQEGIKADLPKIEQSKGKQKYIWIEADDKSLLQKEITIGSNDGINVQVISGINDGEKVITALEMQQANSGKEGNKNQNSPFMPKRPSRNNSKAK